MLNLRLRWDFKKLSTSYIHSCGFGQSRAGVVKRGEKRPERFETMKLEVEQEKRARTEVWGPDFSQCQQTGKTRYHRDERLSKLNQEAEAGGLLVS